MNGYLIDTNVVSELVKPRPHVAVVTWLQARESIVLSAISIDELTYGIERAKGKARDTLREWFADLLGAEPRIIPVTAEIAATAGRLRAQREAAGRQVAQADMLVAACALSEGLVLATRNVRDFAGCGLALFNPFD
jgi:predicted nucleic acid-binding protein